MAAGVTSREIERRQERGYLIAEFAGVYRVGHCAPNVEARYMAAVRACGEGAALSGRAAAHLYGLIKGPEPPPHVIASRKRRVRGVVTAGSRVIERTLVDLASSLSVNALARACHEAGVRYGTTPGHVEEVLVRHPTAPGARKLRLVMRGQAPVSQSVLERRFLRLLDRHNLPLPDSTNRRTGSFRVDCRWENPPLTVELDSYRFHNSRHSWEQDRRREREARARGDDFRRYTYGNVCEDSRQMLRELRSVLGKRGT